MRIEHHLPVDAPVERLWELFNDIDRLPDLSPTITDVEKLDEGPVEVGTRVRVQQVGQEPNIWTAVDVEPLERMSWSAPFHGGTMLVVRELTGLGGDRCLLTLQIEVAGVRAQFAAAARRMAMSRGMQAEADAFAAAATEEADGPADDRSSRGVTG